MSTAAQQQARMKARGVKPFVPQETGGEWSLNPSGCNRYTGMDSFDDEPEVLGPDQWEPEYSSTGVARIHCPPSFGRRWMETDVRKIGFDKVKPRIVRGR